MTGKQKTAVWVLAISIVSLSIAAALFFIRPRPPAKPTVLTGVVLVKADDPPKQIPVANAAVTAETPRGTVTATSDVSGLFRMTILPQEKGQAASAALRITHPGYLPFEIADAKGDQIYLAYMTSAVPAATAQQPANRAAQTLVQNVRVRYSEKATTTNNTGSLVKTFEVNNKGNVPCDGKGPCSPDGKWKATLGSFTVEGQGQEFGNVRLACIAGPCPFTRVQPETSLNDSKRLRIAILNWSDTTTFLLEAEVSQTIVMNLVRQSYPAIFGSSMSFTLPATGEGPSFEAEVGGHNIVFPLGPDLLVSWAVCTSKVAADKSKLFRCDLKAGYRFP